MVKKIAFIFLWLPVFLFSASFTASLSQNPVPLGESFTLELTLHDAVAKGLPSFSSLKKDFVVHSQQQFSNTVMTNGRVSSRLGWKVVLIAQKEGQFLLPSLSIETDKGILSTEAIALEVTKRDSTSSDAMGLILATNLSNAKPYKNEPFLYTVRLTSKNDLANLQMQKMEIVDAIMEPVGDPKVTQQVIDGTRVGVVEFSYYITPLKAGALHIPAAIIQGGAFLKQKRGYFDDDYDLFSGLMGFNQLKPFVLTSEAITVNVQPAVASVNPWLPAQSLSIEEIFDENQVIQAGEPLSRTVIIHGKGVKASQLPGISESHGPFKVYADKPVLDEEIVNGILQSSRKEQLTLVPQQAGLNVLPEITIDWWNVEKGEKQVAKLPARTFTVAPALTQEKAVSLPETTLVETVVVQQNPWLYALAGLLGGLLVMALFWGITLQRKIARLTEAPPKKKEASPKHASKAKPSKKEELPDLNPT